MQVSESYRVLSDLQGGYNRKAFELFEIGIELGWQVVFVDNNDRRRRRTRWPLFELVADGVGDLRKSVVRLTHVREGASFGPLLGLLEDFFHTAWIMHWVILAPVDADLGLRLHRKVDAIAAGEGNGETILHMLCDRKCVFCWDECEE